VEPQGESALRDYLIAWSEVGLASEPMLAHFAEFLGPRAVGEVVAAYDAERANPFTFFDAILCVSLESTPEHWQTMRRRFSRLAIADRVHRISATAADNHHVARALSHRKAVRYAKVRGLTNVLVFQDDVVFLPGTSRVLRRSLRELDRRPWDVLYLGGHPRDLGDTRTFVPLPGCSYLEQVEGMICTHALAYHQRVYDTILAQLPANEDDMADWITANGSIDRYLTERVKGAYRTVPVLALEGTTD
jgi:hypothetical protein